MTRPLIFARARRTRGWLVGLLALSAGCSRAPAASPPVAAATSAALPHDPVPPPAPPPSVPERRADLAEEAPAGGLLGARWRERHEAQRSDPARRSAQLVLLGGGLADGWYHSRAFQRQWRERKPLNLALPGDQTQQLIWRIEHGALDGLAPRLVLLALGSENLAQGFTPAQTARGVSAVLQRVRERLPGAALVLLGLLPAGQSARDPQRALGDAGNAELRAMASALPVTLVEAGGLFLEADGSLTPGLLGDDARPTALGYEALTIAVSLIAQRLLDGSRWQKTAGASAPLGNVQRWAARR